MSQPVMSGKEFGDLFHSQDGLEVSLRFPDNNPHSSLLLSAQPRLIGDLAKLQERLEQKIECEPLHKAHQAY